MTEPAKRTALPLGFAAPPEPDRKKAREYYTFAEGVVCWYDKTRYVNAKVGGKEHSLHVFVDLDADEIFEVFGCAGLDAQLSTVKRASKVFLRYDGKQTKGGKSLHLWTVGVAAPDANAHATNDTE